VALRAIFIRMQWGIHRYGKVGVFSTISLSQLIFRSIYIPPSSTSIQKHYLGRKSEKSGLEITITVWKEELEDDSIDC
jgi:hypothetical protein